MGQIHLSFQKYPLVANSDQPANATEQQIILDLQPQLGTDCLL